MSKYRCEVCNVDLREYEGYMYLSTDVNGIVHYFCDVCCPVEIRKNSSQPLLDYFYTFKKDEFNE